MGRENGANGGYSNADTCSLHGDLFVFPDTPAEDVSGENVTHLLCQACSGC